MALGRFNIEKKNYPIAFHCTYGRDRTGTLAFTIEALLGVPKKSLYKDYELSFFSRHGSHGAMTATRRLEHFTALYRYFRTYGDAGTLSERVEQFLVDEGLTRAQIRRIRTILLG